MMNGSRKQTCIVCQGVFGMCPTMPMKYIHDKYMYMYVLEWWTVYVLTNSRVLFWRLFPDMLSNEGNDNQNTTRASA